MRQGAALCRGQVLPVLRRAVEQTGVSDETEVFTTLPEELRNAGGAPADGGIDLSAFDAARRQSRQALEDAEETMAIDPLADTSEQPAASRVPQQRPEARPRPTQDAPRTTYYGGRPDPDDRVYRKPSRGRRAAVVTLVVLARRGAHRRRRVVLHEPSQKRRKSDACGEVYGPRRLRQGAFVL